MVVKLLVPISLAVLIPVRLDPGAGPAPGPTLTAGTTASVFLAGQQGTDVSALGYDKGDPQAVITIVEFGDFGCSACAQFETETFAQLNREFILPGRVRWKFIPFVLGSFPNSGNATKAAECAAEQSSFWSMHNVLFRRQRDWLRVRDPRAILEEFASDLRLDPDEFRTCYSSDAVAERIERNTRVAAQLMIRATPTFFINGQRALGALPIEQWRRIIEVGGGGAS